MTINKPKREERMKLYTDRDILKMIGALRATEKGRGVSEADSSFKRGYRTALKELRDIIKNKEPV